MRAVLLLGRLLMIASLPLALIGQRATSVVALISLGFSAVAYGFVIASPIRIRGFERLLVVIVGLLTVFSLLTARVN